MTRRAAGFLPGLAVDRRASASLHRQIADQVARAIQSGQLLAGERLPSTRAVARLLGISRNTVIAAYEELAARELLEARRGGGMHVPSAAAHRPLTMLHRSRIPVRKITVCDVDGNPLYLTF